MQYDICHYYVQVWQSLLYLLIFKFSVAWNDHLSIQVAARQGICFDLNFYEIQSSIFLVGRMQSLVGQIRGNGINCPSLGPSLANFAPTFLPPETAKLFFCQLCGANICSPGKIYSPTVTNIFAHFDRHVPQMRQTRIFQPLEKCWENLLKIFKSILRCFKRIFALRRCCPA